MRSNMLHLYLYFVSTTGLYLKPNVDSLSDVVCSCREIVALMMPALLHCLSVDRQLCVVLVVRS